MCFCVPTLLLYSLKILLHPCDFIYLICYVASASTEDVVLSRVGHAHKLNLEPSVFFFPNKNGGKIPTYLIHSLRVDIQLTLLAYQDEITEGAREGF